MFSLLASALDSNFTILGPIDGSGNADASICTATTFGVFEQPRNNTAATNAAEDHEQLVQNVLQSAKKMRAAGYCLYSSATVLVYTLHDKGVYGFTLDPQIQDFVLTHLNLMIPKQSNVYSCDEDNFKGWDKNWKSYSHNKNWGKMKQRNRMRFAMLVVWWETFTERCFTAEFLHTPATP